MSRIGKLPIKVSKDINIQIEQNIIQISGKQGTLTLKIPKEIKINFKNNLISIEKNELIKSTFEKYGLIRSLVNNMIMGVDKKFEKKLQMIGVGYKAQLNNNFLILNVGFSHPIKLLIPEDIEIILETNTNIIVKSADKEKVGLFASKIRAIRKPEPYKGKGISYFNEIILRKNGKSSK